MSARQTLSDDARQLIETGKGDTPPFKPGSQSYLLAIDLSTREGGILPAERERLCKEYGITTRTFGDALTKLRKLGLWDDAFGGKGRKTPPPPPENPAPQVPSSPAPQTATPAPQPQDAARQQSSTQLGQNPAHVNSAVAQTPTGTGQPQVAGAPQPPPNVSQPGTPAPQPSPDLMAKMFDTLENVNRRIEFLEKSGQQGQPVPDEKGRERQRTEPRDAIATFLRDMAEKNPEQLRQLLSVTPAQPGTGAVKPQDTMLRIFQALDSGTAWVDIMDEYSIEFEEMTQYLEKYNRMKQLDLASKELSEPYLKVWFDIAKVVGENIRRGCQSYNEADGTCQRWGLDDVPATYRKTYPGMFRTDRNKQGTLINVERHPEICSICHRAMVLEGEA